MTNENITLEAALEKLKDDTWKMAHLEPRHREALLLDRARLLKENRTLRADIEELCELMVDHGLMYPEDGQYYDK